MYISDRWQVGCMCSPLTYCIPLHRMWLAYNIGFGAHLSSLTLTRKVMLCVTNSIQCLYSGSCSTSFIQGLSQLWILLATPNPVKSLLLYIICDRYVLLRFTLVHCPDPLLALQTWGGQPDLGLLAGKGGRGGGSSNLLMQQELAVVLVLLLWLLQLLRTPVLLGLTGAISIQKIIYK